ncbi:hypothetical protein GGI07_001865 [Coemansia sp. Benny D115]|nr:hypothetical protein GGI07_001865 [Coemansia sp. Benny D115]
MPDLAVMEEAVRKYNLLLHTSLAAPVTPGDTDALRAAVDHTTGDLTVFVLIADLRDTPHATGWALVQRRVADLYAIAMGRALRNKTGTNVDIVLLDFCAYTADDMDHYKHSPTLVAAADSTAQTAATPTHCPAWWPAEMRSAALAVDPRVSVALTPNPALVSRSPIPWTVYSHVAVGGTFDHLHFGHKILLTATALAATKRIVCGISADALLENKRYAEFLEPYRTRELNVLLFLRKVRKDLIVELVPISDPYGPTATDSTIGALVVSQETLPASAALNDRRAENGLASMCLMPVDLITTSSSSARNSRALDEKHDQSGCDGNGSGEDADNSDDNDGASVSTENTALKISSTAIRATLAAKQQRSSGQ